MKSQFALFVCFIILIQTSISLKVGETESIESVSFSEAKLNNAASTENNLENFKLANYVEKLPPKKQLRGEVTTVDEIKSNSDYYDGSSQPVITEKTTCDLYISQPDACKKIGSCGWCASSNSCIPGNANGPLLPCQKGQYQFSAPADGWNPYDASVNTTVTTAKVGGQTITTIVPSS